MQPIQTAQTHTPMPIAAPSRPLTPLRTMVPCHLPTSLDFRYPNTTHPRTRPPRLRSDACRCKEDELDCTFELCDEVTDADRTPEVLAAVSAAFAGFGGVGSSF